MRPKAEYLTDADNIQFMIFRNMNLICQWIDDKLKLSKIQVQHGMKKKSSTSGGSRGRQNLLSSEQADQIEVHVRSSRETSKMTFLELARGGGGLQDGQWPKIK